MMDFHDRDALLEDDPHTYYLKEHYVGYPCVLVRLSRVPADALRDSRRRRSPLPECQAQAEDDGPDPAIPTATVIGVRPG
jgi:hypothetical protein